MHDVMVSTLVELDRALNEGRLSGAKKILSRLSLLPPFLPDDQASDLRKLVEERTRALSAATGHHTRGGIARVVTADVHHPWGCTCWTLAIRLTWRQGSAAMPCDSGDGGLSMIQTPSGPRFEVTWERTRALAVLVAAAVIFLVASPASAGPPFVGSSVTQYDSVIAGGSSISSDGCQVTEWAIYAANDFDGHHNVDYGISTRDNCIGEVIASASGHTGDATFKFVGLHSAVVQATIPLFDWPSGAPAGQITINNTFKTFGPAESDQYHFRSENLLLQISSTGVWKSAESSGTVPVDFAIVTRGQQHVVQIVFNPV